MSSASRKVVSGFTLQWGETALTSDASVLGVCAAILLAAMVLPRLPAPPGVRKWARALTFSNNAGTPRDRPEAPPPSPRLTPSARQCMA